MFVVHDIINFIIIDCTSFDVLYNLVLLLRTLEVSHIGCLVKERQPKEEKIDRFKTVHNVSVKSRLNPEVVYSVFRVKSIFVR